MWNTLKIISIEFLPTFKFAVQISGKIIDDDKILKRFEMQNYNIELQIFRWKITECLLMGRGYQLILEVDPLSYEKIKFNNFKLSFGMNVVRSNEKQNIMKFHDEN